MARNLRISGLALVIALALSGVAASGASASPAVFTANVGAGETAVGTGQLIGTGSMTLNGLKLTCSTAVGSGEALTKGPESKEIRIVPTYSGCHVVVAGLTKLATITTNGCTYLSTATVNAGVYTAPVTLECPIGKQMEVHIYNAAGSEATTLCTYDAKPQGPITGITLTNIPGSPSHVAGHGKGTASVVNTIKSALCGQNEIEVATMEGNGTVQVTNESGAFVDGAVSG